MTKKNGRAVSPARAAAKPAKALVPAEAKGLPALPGAGSGGVVLQDGGTTLVAGQPYRFGGRAVDVDAVYYVADLKSKQRGPWLGEADKVAWLDEASGYECIIMRSTSGGHLSGYVGVPAGHPLHGYEHDAIPADLDIDVHGGISYSRACQRGPTPQARIVDEARRICHVHRRGPTRRMPITNATDYEVQHDDAWWLGFECNQVYDMVPEAPAGRAPFLAAEVGRVYRDEAYVYDEVVHLAAQLRAIADGLPRPEREGPPVPALGLDPRQGG